MCEIEKLKTKLYFMEAEMADAHAIKTADIKAKTASESSGSPDRFEIIHETKKGHHQDLEDTISNNSFNTGDWAKVNMPEPEFTACDRTREFKDLSLETFSKDVFSLCYLQAEPADNDIFDVFRKESAMDNAAALIHIVTHALLKIVPNVILNKREEVIPVLMSAIYLNPKASERDKLLQQLFHLKKRPTETERLAILGAVVGISKHAGEQLVENEILPQCWLQLSHKHLERRLLVAEACTLLIPYVSSPIRNSLILSMLQQMLDDKEEAVRQQIIKALALLFCQCQDPDKYPQCEQLAFGTLKDPSNSVVMVSVQVVFPVLAKWALQSGYLTSSLLKKLLNKLNEHVKSLDSHQNVEVAQRALQVLDNLLPFLLTSVAYHENVISHIEKDVTIPLNVASENNRKRRIHSESDADNRETSPKIQKTLTSSSSSDDNVNADSVNVEMNKSNLRTEEPDFVRREAAVVSDLEDDLQSFSSVKRTHNETVLEEAIEVGVQKAATLDDDLSGDERLFDMSDGTRVFLKRKRKPQVENIEKYGKRALRENVQSSPAETIVTCPAENGIQQQLTDKDEPTIDAVNGVGISKKKAAPSRPVLEKKPEKTRRQRKPRPALNIKTETRFPLGSDLPPSKKPGVKNLTKMSEKYRAIFERLDKFVGFDPITGLIKPKPKFEDMCQDSDTSSSPSVPTQESSYNWPDLEIECR